MSRWSERVDNHPVFDCLASILTEIDDVPAADVRSDEPREDLDRLRTVALLVQARLNATDHELLPHGVLDQIHGNANKVLGELRQFRDSKAPETLTRANNVADHLLIQLSNLYLPVSEEDIAGLKDSVKSARHSAAQLNRYLLDELDESKEHVATLRDGVGSLKADIQSQTKRLDTAVTQFQEQFSTAQERRLTEFGELVEESREKWSETQRNIQSAKTEYLASSKGDVEAFISEIKQHQEEAKSILGAIAMAGMAKGYQDAGQEERSLTNWWRAGALVFLVGLIAFASYIFFGIEPGAWTWPSLGARALVIVTLGVAAAYCARQGEHHLHEARRHRRLELELASINAFLESLPEDLQAEVKKQVADRVFGHPYERLADSQSDENTAGTLMDVIKMLVRNNK